MRVVSREPIERLGLEEVLSVPFTLCMSSGFFGFYAHGGMLSALVSSGFSPRRVVGSSAGALVAGCYAAGVSMEEMADVLFGLTRAQFWDPALGAGLLRGEKFARLLEDVMGRPSKDAHIVPFSCSAWNVATRQTTLLDGSDLVGAVRASCAFPGMFQPVRVGAQHYLDGGIGDRPGFASLSGEEVTLYHHLSTRSPWRLTKAVTVAPARTATCSLDLGGFERVSPWQLDAGPRVWADARERTLRMLAQTFG